MRLENGTTLNGVSAEISEPFHHAVAVIENKIKNLQQLKNKIESYKKAQKDGHILSFEQLSLVARLDDVQNTLKNFLDMQKQFDCIALDTERDQQQLALKAELERTQQDIAKIKEILLIQDVLENMRRDDVRKDFLTGQNGAVKLSEDALDNLDDFYVEISLVRGTEEEFPAFQDQLQQSAQHLLALVEGREEEIIGTTYAKLKELISVIHMCGYFDHVSKDSVTDSDDELSGDVVDMCEGEDDAEHELGTVPVIGKVEVQNGIKEQPLQDVIFVTDDELKSSSILKEEPDEKSEDFLPSSPVRKSIRVKVTSKRLAGFDLDGYGQVTNKVAAVSEAKQFFCSECAASFPNRYRLKVHMDSHPFKQLFSCELCDKKFSFQSFLNDHMQTHSSKTPISCIKCKAKFSSNENLEKHMLTHVEKKKHVVTSDNKQQFSCKICGASFFTKRSLENHIKMHSTEKSFSCSICEASFPQSESLTNHLQTAHKTENPFSCTVCEAIFYKRSDLLTHCTSHSSEKPVYCTVCKARFPHKNQLTAHMLTHSVKNQLDCSICNATFANKYSLKVHMNTHSGEKPFSCSVCKVSFGRKDNLKKHIFRHCINMVSSLPNGKENFNHSEIERRIRSCRYCEETFTSKGKLTAHMRIHDDKKPFSCSVCGAKFTGKNYLNTHMQTHTKPYSCTICKARFGYSYSLNHHMNLHTGKKPFKCTNCSSKFSSKDYLQAHMYNNCAKEFSDVCHLKKKRKTT